MAISPLLQYPSQIITTDPAYPLGKARNVITKGDGTGTPWEANLVNDLFGFLQSLLSKAGIAASNVPDKVGASQYLAALPKAIADQAIEWTAAHKFDAALALNGASNEISYTPLPRIRTIVIDPTSARQRGGAYGDLTLNGHDSFAWFSTAAPTTLLYTFRLPHQAILTRVRVGLGPMAFSSNNVALRAYQVSAVTSGAPGANTKVDLGASSVTVGGANVVLPLDTTALATSTNGSTDFYAVEVDMSAALASILWLEAQFADPGPRNF